jgi:class 3 adenylate cyclase
MEDPSSLPRGTVTFLFTDIERSTEHARRLGADFARLRATHHAVLRAAIAEYGGYEIDTAGDGFFVAFERAADAVAAAAAAQRALHEAETADEPLRVRMGVHTAEPFVDGRAYIGVGVHRAARICAGGHGGQILLSNATAGIVEDLDVAGVALLDLGEYRLKDIERPQRLFQVDVEGLPTTFPPVKSLDTRESRPAVMTLLCTDLVGWGDVLRELGDEDAAAVAEAYQEVVIAAVRAENGQEVEVVADTVMAVFERPSDAIRAAVRLRDALRTERWSVHVAPLQVRVAVHSGRIHSPTRTFGTVAMNVASLCEAAEPGQILVSHATEALLEGERLEIVVHDAGERALGKRERPVHVFEVA